MQTVEASNWNGMTTLASTKALNFQYSESPKGYDVYLPEAQALLWHMTLVKDGGADVTDFETNYKPGANKAIITGDDLARFTTNGRTFSFGVSLNAASSGTDNPLVLIKNPSTSGKVLYFYQILGGCSVTNTSVEFKVIANPTITANGTTQTIFNDNVGSGAVSAMQAFTLPTMTAATGSNLSDVQYGQNSTSIELIEDDFVVTLQPGNSLVVTGNPGSNSRQVNLTFQWIEV
jgi:hypothetical protein